MACKDSHVKTFETEKEKVSPY